MTELFYYDENGTAYSLPCIALTLQWTLTGQAGVLKADISGEMHDAAEGCRIVLKQDGKTVFLGYLFSRKIQKNMTRFTAYDSLRYLLYRDSFAFYRKSVSEIVRTLAAQQNLPLGEITDTGYKIPELLCDNMSLLDIIYSAIRQNTLATGKQLIFYDDTGRLTLKSEADMRLNHILTEDESLYDLQQSFDIDEDTYNRIILHSSSAKFGRKRFEAKDEENIRRWGVLSLYQEIPSGLNNGQAVQMAKSMLSQKNREKENLKVTAIGDFACRAGCSLRVRLNGEENFYQIQKAEHQLEKGKHIMMLSLCRI